jgi:hypothetical protein
MEVAGANPEWATGFCGEPLRLIQQSVAKDDPEPKAVSCYGLSTSENSTRRGSDSWRAGR